MKTLRSLLVFVLGATIIRAEIPPPRFATVPEINAGTSTNTGISPAGLAHSAWVSTGPASFGTITGVPTDNSPLATALGAKVSTATTVNGHPLSGNVTITTGDVLAFGTLAVTGQPTITANSTSQMITFAAGANITITTNSTTGTITISAAGGGGGGSGTVTATAGALTLGHAHIGNGGTDTKVTPVTIDSTTGDMTNIGNVTASGAFSFSSISWGSTLVPKLNGGFGASVASANGIPWFSSGTLGFLSITGISGNAIRVGGTPSDGLIPKYNVSDGSVTWQADNTASGGTGDFSSNTSTSVDGEVVVFSGTAGKTGKRATGTGVAKIISGVLGTATPGTDYVAPSAIASMVDLTTAQTLQNKRIKLRVNPITSSATPTTNTDNFDEVKITALAADITSMTTNLTGSPNEGDVLLFDILDNGTARAITWGVSFENGLVALPTTTTVSKHLYVTFIWQSTDSKWFCMNSASQL